MSKLNDIDQDESFLNRYAWHIALFVLIPLFIFYVIIYPGIEVASLQGNFSGIQLIETEYKIRATAAQIVGGIAILYGLYITHRRMNIAEEELQVAREGQITERFTRAIDQLGNPQAEIRLGGIYALKRISEESNKDYWPIMEILASYVRLNSPLPNNQPLEKVETDIQTVCTILGNRLHHESDSEYGILDLRNTNLRGVDLEKYYLKGVNFAVSHLEEANLRGAHLEDAHFEDAVLIDADLTGAHLERADLRGAHLKGKETILWGTHLKKAKLIKARLEEANLTGAHLEGAWLHDAHFEDAVLTCAHLEGAVLKDAHLERADIFKVQLEGADLTNANLDGVVLSSLEIEQ
ncbi:pentapeptide repeat-containing protein, partial [Methanococcoides sp.]|uniref:pentapeptide repeat-containing protein n=1 Tax=Methanococcoides sp. TaxID=1966350 RepID=UPI00272E2C3F